MWRTMAALLAGVLLAGAVGADEQADQVAAQKRAAEAHLKNLEIAKPQERETANLLIYGNLPEARLKTIGELLEKQLGHARKALAFEEKEKLWPGKLTAYVFAEREQFTSFVRTVEKRRAEAEDFGSFALKATEPHIAAGPATDKDGPSIDAQIGTQLGGILLKKKADKAVVPAWVSEAFGRATIFMTATGGYSGARERGTARTLMAKVNSVKDVWSGGLKDQEARILATSLIYYLAYGPAAGRLPAVIAGFALDENGQPKTMEDALTAAKINLETLDQRWQAWARGK